MFRFRSGNWTGELYFSRRAPVWRESSRWSRIVLLLGLLLSAGFSSGCGRTVNDYLMEARSGSPEAVLDAVDNISDLLARKEITGVPFDEGDWAALEYLKTVAREKTSGFHTNRSAAIGGLGRLKSVDSPTMFLEALQDDFWLVRMKAANALSRKGNEDSVPEIVERFESEPRKEVRLAMVGALSAIGGERAIKALFETFLRRRERARDVDVVALWALRKLTGLTYSIEDSSDWQAAYDARFGSTEETRGEAGVP